MTVFPALHSPRSRTTSLRREATMDPPPFLRSSASTGSSSSNTANTMANVPLGRLSSASASLRARERGAGSRPARPMMKCTGQKLVGKAVTLPLVCPPQVWSQVCPLTFILSVFSLLPSKPHRPPGVWPGMILLSAVPPRRPLPLSCSLRYSRSHYSARVPPLCPAFPSLPVSHDRSDQNGCACA